MELMAAEKMILGMMSADEHSIKSNFLVKEVKDRGRSVFARKQFKKGDFVIEYKGVCTKFDQGDYLKNAQLYHKNQELSYCLEFWYNGERYCIDATRDYEHNISRLINHVRNPNLKLFLSFRFRPLVISREENPRIAMFAAKDIDEGEELFWNYFSTFDPARCMLDKTNTSEIRWTYSYLTKSGNIII
jgi:SET domain-containing protein